MAPEAGCKRERPTILIQAADIELERLHKKQEIDWEWVRQKELRRELIGQYKPGRVAYFKEGKRASLSCVIVDTFVDELRGNKLYSLVTGVAHQEAQGEEAAGVKCYIKLVESNMLTPSDVKFAVDFRDLVTFEAFRYRSKKKFTARMAKERFKERYETGKDSSFFKHIRSF